MGILLDLTKYLLLFVLLGGGYVLIQIYLIPRWRIFQASEQYGRLVEGFYYPLIGVYVKNREKKPTQGIIRSIQNNPKLKAIVSNLGHKTLWVFVSPETIQKFTVEKNEDFVKYLPIFNIKVIELSVLFTEGEKWKKQRKMISHSFSYQNLQSGLQKNREVIKACFRELGVADKGNYEEVKICDLGMKISGQMAVRFFFGEEFSETKINGVPIALELGHFVDKFLRFSQQSAYFNIKRLIFGPRKASEIFLSEQERELTQLYKTYYDIGNQTVQKRLDQLKSDQSLFDRNSFLDIIVKAHIEDPSQTPFDEIIQQAMGMFIAATDNTGIIMGMVLYCLAKYPQEQELVRKELDSLIKNGDPDQLETVNFESFERTSAFIKECFRHYSSSYGVFIRQAVRDTWIDGLFLKKGDLATVNWYGPFNNPELYEEPSKFDSGRFLNNKSLNQFAWTPFSAGPRNCIGKLMSLNEILLVLIYFMKEFDFVLNEDIELRMTSGLTLHPVDDRLIKIKRKQAQSK